MQSLYILLRQHPEVDNSFHLLCCIQICDTEVKSHHTHITNPKCHLASQLLF